MSPFPGTLRDWFAGQALQGLAEKFMLLGSRTGHVDDGLQELASCVEECNLDLDEFIAWQCYTIADAMLAQREKE